MKIVDAGRVEIVALHKYTMTNDTEVVKIDVLIIKYLERVDTAQPGCYSFCDSIDLSNPKANAIMAPGTLVYATLDACMEAVEKYYVGDTQS